MRVTTIILLLGLLFTGRCSMKQAEPIQPTMPQSIRGWHEQVDKGVRSVAELVLKEGEKSDNGRVEVRADQIIPADLRAERNSYFGSPRVVLSFYKSTDKTLLCRVTFMTAGGGLDQAGCDTKSMGFEAMTVHAINTKEKWVWFSLFE
jgi:hypothetical protein